MKPWTAMTIAWNGDVLLCCFDYDAKCVVGNVKEQTLIQIWDGDKVKAIREEFKGGVLRNALCCKCKDAYK